MNELLEVEDSFVIEGRGVVLFPDFSIPEGGWTTRQEQVQLEMADGSCRKMLAHIDWVHFTLRDPHATADQKNRVVVRLTEAIVRLPKGTKVYASADLCEALLPASQ